ncbi:MAG: hypothetical protein MO846_01885 [Candidatus Devosia symbiotica]|nr:hypothetical protein [Candidatus Devosia symbiotica]
MSYPPTIVITVMIASLVSAPIFMLIIGSFIASRHVDEDEKAAPEFGTVNVITRANYSPVEIRDPLIEMEKEILQVHGIQDVIMSFGGSGGLGSRSSPDTVGSFNLQLMPYNKRVKAEEIFQDIRTRVADISGLDVQIPAQEDSQPAGKAINIRVEGTVYGDISPTVAKLRDFIENDLGDTIDVEDGHPAPNID